MVEITLKLTEDNYQHLNERAGATGQSIEELLNSILESEAEWRRTLTKDPMFALFGSLDSGDSTTSQRVDEIVYRQNRPE